MLEGSFGTKTKSQSDSLLDWDFLQGDGSGEVVFGIHLHGWGIVPLNPPTHLQPKNHVCVLPGLGL